MSKRFTTEEFIERAKTVHGDRYGYEKVEYKNNSTKVIITCSEHEDFEQTPSGHLSGKGCLACGGSEKLTTKTFIQRAKEVHEDRYAYDKMEYKNNSTKVIITCSEHGDFKQTPNSHLAGQGCRTCGVIKRAASQALSQSEFIEKAKVVHGDQYTYDKVVYVNTRTNVIITCFEHGDFEQIPSDHLRGHHCADCSGLRKLTTSTFIEKAKDKHGDRYGYDKVEYVSTHKKVTITCSEHGDFRQSPASHLRGSGCRACGGREPLTIKTFIEKTKEVHGDRYGYDKVEYVTARTKVIITCFEHGDFEQTPDSHLSGQGCRTCGGTEPLTTETFIEKAKEVHGDRYGYDKVEYVSTHKKVTITCSEHGDFRQSPASHLRGSDCRTCGGTEPLTTETFIEKAKEVHGDRYGYDKVEYVNGHIKVIITCSEHGDFEQSLNSHLSGRGCRTCGGSDLLTTETFIEKAKEVHGDRYVYDKVEYVNSHTNVIITCSEHGEFHQAASTHLSGGGCPRCINKAEGRFAIYLNERYITHRQHRIENKYFDFYLPVYKLLIERDGEQHYLYRKSWADMVGDVDYLTTQQANDQEKTDLAKQHGYKIARVPYWLTDEEVELELDNILKGQPTYPDVPDLEQAKTQPRPRVDRDG